MIYKHDNWGELKQYSLTADYNGLWKLTEYSNKCRKTSLTLTTEQKIKLVSQLKEQGFYEHIRS